MALAPKTEDGRLNLDKPKWSQDNFSGRAKHFFTVTDPRNLFTSNENLEAAKKLVKEYRLGQEPVGTTDEQVSFSVFGEELLFIRWGKLL